MIQIGENSLPLDHSDYVLINMWISNLWEVVYSVKRSHEIGA